MRISLLLLLMPLLLGCMANRPTASGPVGPPAGLATADTGSMASAPAVPPPAAPKTGVEAQVDSVLALLTLEEKIGQLVQYTGDFDQTGPSIRPGYERLIRQGLLGSLLNVYTTRQTRQLQDLALQSRHRIPLLFAYDVIHGFRTIYPIPLGMAATWDTSLVQQTAAMAASEASAAGIHWTFAPMVDVARDPRWGRVMEGAGEDPFLGSAMARAQVRGFQGTDLTADSTVAACAKHFAAYGAAEAGRDYNTVDLSELRLRETYLPPFKACVDAGVQTFMTAFNELNGVPATASPLLLTEILRNEWDFDGVVISDYNAVEELMDHGYAADSTAAGVASLLAGTDIDMMASIYETKLPAAVAAGQVPMRAIDEAVRRVLRLKFRLGLFTAPHRYSDSLRERERIFTPAHRALARRAAVQSLVLLQNTQDLLPLTGRRRIAVVGPLADAQAEMNGAWSAAGQSNEPVTVLAGLRAAVGAGTTIRYAKGCDIDGTSRQGFAAAVAAARASDVVVAVLGEAAQMSGEAASRSDIGLPGQQAALVQALVATGKPVVLVVFAGRPLVLEPVRESVGAILYAWFPGTEAGSAVAEVLLGRAAPSGRLPMSFPRVVGQIPIYYNAKATGRPMTTDTKYVSRYLDVPNAPAWPFGFGLTYTRFAYGPVRLSQDRLTAGGQLTATVTVRNTGTRPGTETVQLYLQDHFATITRPVRELKGWQQVTLAPGDSAEVQFVIRPEALVFWHPVHRDWRVEPGAFSVYIGPHAGEGARADFLYRAP